MFKMARIHVFLILFVQVLVIQGDDVEDPVAENINVLEEVASVSEEPAKHEDGENFKNFHPSPKDWMDLLLGPNSTFYPSASASLMTQAANSNKTAEEQLEDIKDAAGTIKKVIQSQLANLLAYTVGNKDPTEDNNLRKRRSVENPLDSTKLVMRLLNHIKSENEFQKIAIDKMMTAQEIAHKYNIEFTPDTDTLADLAIAANNHASDLVTLLEDTCKCEQKKKEEVKRICERNDKVSRPHNHTYYTVNLYPDQTPYDLQNNRHYCNIHHNLCHSEPCTHHHYLETQIPRPPVHHIPATPKPSYFETMSYPQQEMFCTVAPMSNTVFLPGEDDFEPEPILTGEEYEETISSKVYVDHEKENGEATVNHVMTYTVAEKSHFKKPEIEKLPEHMQYCFLLL